MLWSVVKLKNVPETNYKTIRSRLTGVVVVPSVVLLAMWALFSSYTVFEPAVEPLAPVVARLAGR